MTRFDLTSPADQKQAPLRQDGPPDESDIQTAMHQWVTAAILHADGQLSVAREEAEKYYKGEPFGNEEEGRSKIVMTELRDAVLQIMPDLLRMFFGGDPAVEYGPSTQNQIQMAEEVTKFVLDVILQQDNQGLLIYSDWFMDALIKRLGVVMCWQDKGKETRHYTLAYQTYDQMTILAADDSIEIEEVTPCEASPPGVKLYDCEYTQTRRWSRTRIQCIPPEEYLYSKGARSVSNDPFMPGVAQFVARRTELTRSQLRGMGVDEDDIEEYGFPDTELSHNTEEIERQHNQVTGDENPIAAEPNRRALWIEAYPFYDLDGDGEAELCRITMLGPAHKIVGTPEPCARRPFALICPQPTPHSIEGQAVSDWTMDLQKTVSLIWRSLLDSLVLALNPRIAYTEGEVSLEDILNVQLAAPIRTRTSPANALQVIEHNFVGAAALPVLDALKQVKKNRVGVDDASAGLDPGALQSTTAMAVAAAQSRAQAHIELIARYFAELGVKPLFRMILELITENPDAERMVKINGNYTPMDPRVWNANLDVRVNVALGAGTLGEKIAALSENATAMETLMPIIGPGGIMQAYRDIRVRMLKLRGFADAELMWPQAEALQPPPKDPNAGDPQMVIAQTEAAKGAAHVQKLQADQQLDAKKHEIETASKGEELRLKEKDMETTDAREREKTEAELVLKVMEMNLKYKTEITVEQVKAEMLAKQQHRTVKLQHNEAGQVIGLEVSHKDHKGTD